MLLQWSALESSDLINCYTNAGHFPFLETAFSTTIFQDILEHFVPLSAENHSEFHFPTEHTPKSANTYLNYHGTTDWPGNFNSRHTSFSSFASPCCTLQWATTGKSAAYMSNFSKRKKALWFCDVWPLQTSDVLSCVLPSWVRWTWEERVLNKNLKWKLNSRHSLVVSVTHHNGCAGAESHG